MPTNQYTWPTTSNSLVFNPSLGYCTNCGKVGYIRYKAGTATPTTNTRLQKCSECRTTLYCSKKCRKAHWRIHQPSCEAERRFTKELKAFGPEIMWKHESLEAWYSKYAMVLALAATSALRLDQGINNAFTLCVYFTLNVIDTGGRDHQGRPIFSYKIQDVAVLPHPAPRSFQGNRHNATLAVDLPIAVYHMEIPNQHFLRYFPGGVYVLASDKFRYYPDWKERLVAVVNEGKNLISWDMHDDPVSLRTHWVLYPTIVLFFGVFCWAWIM